MSSKTCSVECVHFNFTRDTQLCCYRWERVARDKHRGSVCVYMCERGCVYACVYVCVYVCVCGWV